MDFEEYVRERRPSLLRFAVVLTGNPPLADDIVADVLGRAFERWSQVRAADNPHAYVRRMVVNEVNGRHRRWGRVTAHADMSSFVGAVADPAVRHAEHAALAAELAKLPLRRRTALVLRFYEGLSYAEIAEVMGTREVSVRANVSRALVDLRLEMSADTPVRSTSLPTEA